MAQQAAAAILPTDGNTRALARDEWMERAISFAFAVPCLFVVIVCVLIPCAWLFWTSLFGADGSLSGEHYSRMIEAASYRRIFITTFQVSLATVAACLVLGVPFATFVNRLPAKIAVIFLAAILLPFWTSLLVRAYAWLILLQRNGIVNSTLVGLGVIDAPLPLAFGYFATVLGMTHIMLPIFLLPVLGAMRTIDPACIRAAASLGASRQYTYWRVFLPLAAPGIAAGALLVFVMSLGFYVTPAILGGGNVTVISMRIARSLTTFSTWGAASALGVVLLILTAAFLALSALIQRILFGSRKA